MKKNPPFKIDDKVIYLHRLADGQWHTGIVRQCDDLFSDDTGWIVSFRNPRFETGCFVTRGTEKVFPYNQLFAILKGIE